MLQCVAVVACSLPSDALHSLCGGSDITLFYTAFVKSFEFPMGALFGDDGINPVTHQAFGDMCGARPTHKDLERDPDLYSFSVTNPACNFSNPVDADCNRVFVRRDCFYDVRLLMISYTVLKPICTRARAVRIVAGSRLTGHRAMSSRAQTSSSCRCFLKSSPRHWGSTSIGARWQRPARRPR